jgi:putative nucleotidyltransferase with HDIG domain
MTTKSERGPAAGAGKGWRFRPGIRLKLISFLLPLVFLLVIAVAWAVTRISERAIRADILQRGVSVARVVAHSAAFSLLSGDRLAMDSLAAETGNSSPDIEYVAIRDMSDVVLAHSIMPERGKPFSTPAHVEGVGTFLETQADEVVRWGREMTEITTPIFFAGKRVGTVSLGLSRNSLVAAQRSIRRSVLLAASAFLVLSVLGTLVLASFITTPVEKLTAGVNELAGGEEFHPIPVRGRDELAELTGNFNRMAETILRQKTRLGAYAKELEESYIATVRVLAASIDARDPYTLGHSTRVSRLCCELGRRLGFPPAELAHLERACLFHDVGKIRTPDEILLKQQRLSSREIGVMRRHPDDGAEILRMAPSLHRYIPVVKHHHEWYNGEGYPEGIRQSQIPVHARIIALADAFDAMTSDRPYRTALTTEEAIDELLRFRATQFSPEMTDAFVQMVRELPPMEVGDGRQARL